MAGEGWGVDTIGEIKEVINLTRSMDNLGMLTRVPNI